MLSLVQRTIGLLPGHINDHAEDIIGLVEQRSRKSQFIQHRLIRLREFMAGFASTRSWNELDLCAAAIVRHTEGYESLCASGRPEAEWVLGYFSMRDWQEVERRVKYYQHGHGGPPP